MSETPLWVPLVVAGLGVLGAVCGTLAGVLITQRRSDRREEVVWERERERERHRWAREDALRTFDHRRSAYEAFYESLREMAETVYDHGLGLSPESEDGKLPEGWQRVTFHASQRLAVYAPLRVYEAANRAYSAAGRWGEGTIHGQDDDGFYDRQADYDAAEKAFLVAMRLDLGIPKPNDTGSHGEFTHG